MKTEKITQNQIAKELNITQGAVSGWFTRDSKPSRPHANQLHKKFDINPDIWDDDELFYSFMKDNSERFGAIKILREKHNDDTKV